MILNTLSAFHTFENRRRPGDREGGRSEGRAVGRAGVLVGGRAGDRAVSRDLLVTSLTRHIVYSM